MRSSVDPILTPSFDQKKETIKLKKKKSLFNKKREPENSRLSGIMVSILGTQPGNSFQQSGFIYFHTYITKEGCSKIDMSLIPKISSRRGAGPGRRIYSLVIQLMWALES